MLNQNIIILEMIIEIIIIIIITLLEYILFKFWYMNIFLFLISLKKNIKEEKKRKNISKFKKK